MKMTNDLTLNQPQRRFRWTSRRLGGLPALALCLLSGVAANLFAQDQTIPLAASLRSLPLLLQPSGLRASATYAINQNNILYFPSLTLVGAAITLNGQLVPFTDANGKLSLPPGTQGAALLCVTLRDFLKDLQTQNEFLDALKANPNILNVAPSPVLQPAATAVSRVAHLILVNPNAANKPVVLAESNVQESQGNATLQADFRLDASVLDMLRG